MIIQEITCHRYSVPFRVPFTTSRGQQQHREGLLLRITTDDGIVGYGETVALTAFGTADLDTLEQHLLETSRQISGRNVEEAHEQMNQRSSESATAPVRFAFDTALLDIQSHVDGKTLSRFISSDAAETVPLNATISDVDVHSATTAASYAMMAGYSAIKMKVGAYADPAGEIERVAAVREAIGPDVELRLDVNGAWPLERAIEMARAFEPYNIGYLEQPLPASDIGAMAELRNTVSIPLAADEAATDQHAIEALLEAEAVDTVVIKPAVVGGITAARGLIDLAHSAGIQVVVTTSLETGVAIIAAAHLAATLPAPVPACGLATGLLLETDLLTTSPDIEGGRMTVPTGPGLGVEPIASIWDS